VCTAEFIKQKIVFSGSCDLWNALNKYSFIIFVTLIYKKLSHKGKVCKLQKLFFFKLVSQTHSQSYIGQKKNDPLTGLSQADKKSNVVRSLIDLLYY